jgi:hypothetical protein
MHANWINIDQADPVKLAAKSSFKPAGNLEFQESFITREKNRWIAHVRSQI